MAATSGNLFFTFVLHMESLYRPKYRTGGRYVMALLGRLFLVLVVYLASRYGFYLFNRYLFSGVQANDWMRIYQGGLRFDLAALFYVNSLYLILALLPFPFVFTRWWQALLKWLFVVLNAVAFASQFMDFVYFQTTLLRTDFSFFAEFANHVHLGTIFFTALSQNIPLFLVWVGVVVGLYFGYGRTRYDNIPAFTLPFFLGRLSMLIVACLISVVAIRGGIDRTTRPISMSNAAAYVKEPIEAGIVLNTPFCLIRTMRTPTLHTVSFFDQEETLETVYSPVHSAPGDSLLKYNVVILILESFSREHIGFLNPPGHPSYTPFLDSLLAVSHACTRAYANGRKSIDAIPSILGSIPSFTKSFALLPYSLDKLEGLGNLLKPYGYHTSFFHGAPNGSMGFDGMVRQLGFDAYYGKDQFNDNRYYDGVWGIWDEPFLQYFAHTLDTLPEPFVSAVFTLSSHDPFKIPKAYEGVFDKGSIPIHQCIGYSDNALRRFFHTASQSSWFAHTLFVLVADHGAYSQLYPQYQTPSGSMAVPIAYYGPNVLPCVDTNYTQQIDIVPTVLSLLKYPSPYVAFGRDVNDSITEPFAIHYPGTYVLLRETKKEPDNELFLKAFQQQYTNRLIENRMTWQTH